VAGIPQKYVREVFVVEGLVSLLPLVAIALLFWLLIIRPASRRQKDQARMQSAVNQGDQVMLTSGVFGTVTELADDHLMVEIASGVVIKVARGAIGSVVRSDDSDSDPEPEADAEAEPSDTDARSEES
jgi:preprotein translocase subunit YajC